MLAKNLDCHIKEMKSFGNFLMPYNFPVAPVQDEDSLTFMKSREATVDGYGLVLYYNKSDWNEYYTETIQVVGKYVPFLPFSLICKIGKKFLGDQNLSFVEIFQESRRIYCWTVVTDREGNSLPMNINDEMEFKDCNYEGFSYRCLNPKEITFY